ncbi:MAG: Flp family type IVb pilin [Janthinobacterium lividum]
MRGLLSSVFHLRDDERGVTALEYGMIGILIAVVIVGAVTRLGTGALSLWNAVVGMKY